MTRALGAPTRVLEDTVGDPDGLILAHEEFSMWLYKESTISMEHACSLHRARESCSCLHSCISMYTTNVETTLSSDDRHKQAKQWQPSIHSISKLRKSINLIWWLMWAHRPCSTKWQIAIRVTLYICHPSRIWRWRQSRFHYKGLLLLLLRGHDLW
jgi:hypothetical protein